MKGIITFHSIDFSDSVLSYPPPDFANFVGALAESSLPVCDLDTLLDPSTLQGVALTFDDGMASVFTQALPVLREYGACAHLFLTTTSVGADNKWRGQSRNAPEFEMLDWKQVEACQEGGIHIENHTATHPDLLNLSEEAIDAECAAADEMIESRLGRRPAYFAYPYGRCDRRVARVTGRRYLGCMTTKLRPLGRAEDRTALPRIDSYYLRSPWFYRRLNAATTRTYLGARSLLRSLRGSQ